MDGTNAQCCLDKGVASALHCAWCMRKDMVCYCESQGAQYAKKAIVPQISFIDMDVMHLKPQVSDRTRSTPEGKLENAPPKPTVRKLTVGGGYCRLQTPSKLALGVREAVAGRGPGALKRGEGGTIPPSNASLSPPPRTCLSRGGGGVCGRGSRGEPPLQEQHQSAKI